MEKNEKPVDKVALREKLERLEIQLRDLRADKKHANSDYNGQIGDVRKEIDSVLDELQGIEVNKK